MSHQTPYLVFTTPTLASIDALTTLGVNVKESDNSIGYFGTGFKFAIATLLRTGHKIYISIGNETYQFSTEPTTIRNKDFNIITFTKLSDMSTKQKLGFTTDLGKNWKIAQAYRELHANTSDENGTISLSESLPPSTEDSTIISITYSKELITQFHNRKIIFPTFGTPAHSDYINHIEIYNNPSTGIYCQGVLVATLPKKSHFTYNLTTNSLLTEDRTISPFTIEYLVASTLISLRNPDLLVDLHTHGKDSFEEFITIDSTTASRFSPEHIEILRSLVSSGSNYLDNFMKGLSLTQHRLLDIETRELTEEENVKLKYVLNFLLDIGLPITHEIKLADTLPQNAIGLASDDKIYLSTKAFFSPLELASTIFEEETHLITG